jgi:hypothetical protein
MELKALRRLSLSMILISTQIQLQPIFQHLTAAFNRKSTFPCLKLDTAAETMTTKSDEKKTNFMAFSWLYFLRKNCFVYEFAIHKSFFSLVLLSLCSFCFFLISENNVFCVKIAEEHRVVKFILVFVTASSSALFNFSPTFLFLLLSPPHQQYSGTNAEFTKADAVIFRSDIYNLTSGRKEHNFKRTLKYDSKWLDSKYKISSSISSHLFESQSAIIEIESLL